MVFNCKKLINGITRRIDKWVERKQLGKVNVEVFDYVDCLESVMKINRYYECSNLCDIGASKGRWSFVMSQLNPNLKKVVLIEPQADLQKELESLNLPNIEKYIYQCAVGDKEQSLELRGGTASASLFEIGSNQHYYFPGTIKDENEYVEVRVLDEIYGHPNLEYPDLIKIDVQGYELNALKGGVVTLSKARYLVIEMSLREFYVGQPKLWELWRFIEKNGFEMLDHGFELRSPKAPYELLQFDAIFKNINYN
jgi:FkbM family methyltransferase